MMRGVRGLIAPLACAVVIVGVPAVAQARTLYVPNVHGRCVKLSKKNTGDKACQLSIKLKATYTLNTPVTVSFKLSLQTTGRKVSGRCVKATRKNKHHAKCPRLVSVHKTIPRSGVAGSNRFSLTAKLAAGTYQLTATPAGGTSQTVTFRVIG